MQVKTFKGRNAGEAMAKVRASLGAEACILETRRAGGGIEILAAMERTKPKVRQTRSPSAEFDGSQSVSIGDLRLDAKIEKPARRGEALALEERMGARGLLDDLLGYGFSQVLASRIARAAAANLDEEALQDRTSALSYARDLIASWLPYETVADDAQQPVIVLVGPPGVGKTTTLAKLAVQEVESSDRRVVMASADLKRLGGVEQSRAYARILGVPFHTVKTSGDLAKARETAGPSGVLLVDTPGVSARDQEGIRHLVEILADIPRDAIEVLLAADSDSLTLASVLQRFAPLSPGAVSATRTDETQQPGQLLTAVTRAGLPLRHVACGPDVPDDLKRPGAKRLAAWAVPLPGEKTSFQQEATGRNTHES